MQSNSILAKDSTDRFGRLVTSVFRHWRRQVDMAFRDLELSDATRMPIIVLHDHGDIMRQKDLARELALDSSSLFRTLETLRQRGLITWQTDPSDRRAKCISLTSDGQKLAHQIRERSLEIERVTLEGISPQDLATTRAVLEETLRRLEHM